MFNALLNGNLKDVETTGRTAGASLATMGKAVGLFAVGTAIAGAAKSAIGFNIQLEQANTTYTTLLGTAEEANKRIAELLTGFSTDVLANLASKGVVKPAVSAAPAAKPAAPAPAKK